MMANENLANPIEIQSAYITPDILPPSFSEVYRRIVLNSSSDMSKLVIRTNETANETLASQIRNDEQDVILDNHEDRIVRVEDDLSKLEVRVLSVENDVDGLKIKIQDLDGQISEIKIDYVSLSKTEPQKLLSPIDVSTSYSVNGVKVVSARVTGFTASTGTASKAGINANQTYNVGAAYSQAEVKAISDALTETRKSLKALEDMARSHGLIN